MFRLALGRSRFCAQQFTVGRHQLFDDGHCDCPLALGRATCNLFDDICHNLRSPADPSPLGYDSSIANRCHRSDGGAAVTGNRADALADLVSFGAANGGGNGLSWGTVASSAAGGTPDQILLLPG